MNLRDEITKHDVCFNKNIFFGASAREAIGIFGNFKKDTKLDSNAKMFFNQIELSYIASEKSLTQLKEDIIEKIKRDFKIVKTEQHLTQFPLQQYTSLYSDDLSFTILIIPNKYKNFYHVFLSLDVKKYTNEDQTQTYYYNILEDNHKDILLNNPSLLKD